MGVDILLPQEAANVAGVSVETIAGWVHNGILPTHTTRTRAGAKSLAVDADDLVAHARTHGARISYLLLRHIEQEEAEWPGGVNARLVNLERRWEGAMRRLHELEQSVSRLEELEARVRALESQHARGPERDH